MLSQIFCYWNKQQSADSNIIQFHFILKCTKDQSSHFCDQCSLQLLIMLREKQAGALNHNYTEQKLLNLLHSKMYYR